MPMWLLTLIAGCILLLNHLTGAVGIHGVSTERDKEPFLYGMGMALGWIIFLGFVALTFFGV